jgi:hypothetical protein
MIRNLKNTYKFVPLTLNHNHLPMRVRRLVELIAITLLIIALISLKNIKWTDSLSLTKATVSKISVPLSAKGIH